MCGVASRHRPSTMTPRLPTPRRRRRRIAQDISTTLDCDQLIYIVLGTCVLTRVKGFFYKSHYRFVTILFFTMKRESVFLYKETKELDNKSNLICQSKIFLCCLLVEDVVQSKFSASILHIPLRSMKLFHIHLYFCKPNGVSKFEGNGRNRTYTNCGQKCLFIRLRKNGCSNLRIKWMQCIHVLYFYYDIYCQHNSDVYVKQLDTFRSYLNFQFNCTSINSLSQKNRTGITTNISIYFCMAQTGAYNGMRTTIAQYVISWPHTRLELDPVCQHTLVTQLAN